MTLFENFLLMNTYNGFLGIPLSSLKPLTSNISSINWSVKKFKTPQILLGTFLISNAHRMGVKFVVFEVFCDVTEFWGWALSGHAGWPIKPTKNKNLSLNLWNTQNSLCGSGRHRWRASLLISPAQRHLLHPSDPSFQLGMYPPPLLPPHTPKHSLAVKNNSWQYVIQNNAAKCFCCFREYLKILHLIRAWYYLMWVMILSCMSLRCNRSCGPTDVHWKERAG